MKEHGTGQETATAKEDLKVPYKEHFKLTCPSSFKAVDSCREEVSCVIVKNDLTGTRETNVSLHKS